MSGAVSFVLGLLGLGAAGGSMLDRMPLKIRGLHEVQARVSGILMLQRLLCANVFEKSIILFMTAALIALVNFGGSIHLVHICILKNVTGSKRILMHKEFRMIMRFWMKFAI